MRTTDEIARQINGLKAEKNSLPSHSAFGDPNHAKIDAQVEILEGITTLDEMEQGDWDDMDEDNQIYRAAEEAQEWLDEERDEDLYDSESEE